MRRNTEKRFSTFLQRFRKRGMRVDGFRQIADGGGHFDGKRRLGDQFASSIARHEDAKYAFALTVDNHNLTSEAVILIEGNDEDVWTTPLFQESIRVHPDCLRYIFTSPYQYRYWRFKITDANNADGYLELGTLHLWNLWESHLKP